MQLTIRLFARAKDLAGTDTVTVQLADPAVIADLKATLKEQFPKLAPLVAHLHFAIGTEYVTDSTPLTSCDAVTCFPPVSGG